MAKAVSFILCDDIQEAAGAHQLCRATLGGWRLQSILSEMLLYRGSFVG